LVLAVAVVAVVRYARLVAVEALLLHRMMSIQRKQG
jgi:hypothetical protein